MVGVAQGAFTQKGPLDAFLAAHPARTPATFTLARRRFVGNADAEVVGQTTATLYKAIRELDFRPVAPK